MVSYHSHPKEGVGDSTGVSNFSEELQGFLEVPFGFRVLPRVTQHDPIEVVNSGHPVTVVILNSGGEGFLVEVSGAAEIEHCVGGLAQSHQRGPYRGRVA
jgi:hypothetical protein